MAERLFSSLSSKYTSICAQHTAFLIEVNNNILNALSEFELNIPNDAVHVMGNKNTDMDLDDED